MPKQPPHQERPVHPLYARADFFAALAAALVSGAVYFYTAQPNVGLLDSGEFIVAAQHFGVPHPTGYPLWTMLAWVFQLLPLGNAAWEINLFSGLCGALAVGFVALLASSMSRWMLAAWMPGSESDALTTVIPVAVAFCFSLLFGFSVPFWTQAVIAEVYTLHGLLASLLVMSIYWWVRRPELDSPIIATFFVVSLCMSNHHLSLAFAPLPLVTALLVRRDLFWEVFVAAQLAAALVYLGFAWLSNDPTTWSTAMRFFYFAMLALIVLLALRWKRTDLRVIFLVPLAVVLGLLPYGYMPLASSTNPPMNWGYTRTAEGFFYSINRTQYSYANISGLILDTIGKVMGTAPEVPSVNADPEAPPRMLLAREFMQYYVAKLMEDFTPWLLIAFISCLLGLMRLPGPPRAFLLVLLLAFLLTAFLVPLLEKSEISVDAWSLQFPFHGTAYMLFTLICAAGTAHFLARLASWKRQLGYLALALPLLPLWTGIQNAPLCSQRDHWFGWDYGRDMLKDLPRDAFVFGGTDPGRFVPTYMILGESFVDPKHRKDADFDRRDLVIVTQNALADAFYQKYIHDHYAPGRPKAKGWFEHWLGRDKQYPPDDTKMPSEQELMEIVKNVSMNLPPGANPQDPNVGILYHAAIAQWIFENNKHKRDFFIEESFPMEWTYAYAIPNGLSYRLNKEPLATLPPDAVENDFKFWNAYVERLLGNKNFHEDFDAKRSFSKLRNSTGNIYRARQMWNEAERAYRQALQLHPNNMESLVAMSDILRAQKRWDEMAEIWDRAIEGDPNNRAVGKARARVTRLREADREIEALQRELAANPQNPEVVSNLLRLYVETGQPDLVRRQLEQSAIAFGDNPEFLKFAVDFCNSNGQWQPGLEFARKLSAGATNDPGVWLALARFEFANRQMQQFLDAARKAVQLGGMQAKAALAQDPLYGMVRGTTEFQQLLQQ